MDSVALAAMEQAQDEIDSAAFGAPLDYPQALGLHQLVELQAARTPDAVAVAMTKDEGRSTPASVPWPLSPEPCHLTYAELDARANRLAHYLRGLGAGPEARVGVCLARTPDLVVAILGVLKSGAAYVPLDPAYPPERLRFMLEDSQARILVTNDEGFNPALVNGPSAFVNLASDWPVIAAQPATAPAVALDPANLAYLIYTSGSTGRPKGVAIAHRSAVALIAWAHTLYTPADLAGVLAATSICFDLSVFELFAPLSCGGRVILIETILQLAARAPVDDVTLINTVPSALTELLRIAPLPASARIVNLAGEPLPLKLAQQLYQTGAVDHVFNLYGPSEDTTYSTFVRVPPAWRVAPTIGRPIANTQSYLLDARMEPVPPGAPGELYLGGSGLARGYLGRPDLTAARFLPNPFAAVGSMQSPVGRASTLDEHQLPTADCRLYKTGDLARLLPNGELEYLGRIDQQVKLRGFRIELGEIEAAIEQHPAVAQAAAIVREDQPGDKQLVAYVVKGSGVRGQGSADPASDALTPDPRSLIPELRAFLARTLPEYMVPSAFVTLDALPLNPNGKLDRKALPAPAAGRSALAGDYAPPQTPLEAELAAIWAEALALDPVGVRDNFFDLGGHSLKATRIIARVRQAFQVELTVRGLFERPTIAELAAQIERERGSDDARHAPLAPIARGSAIPTSFAQQRLWFSDQLAPGNPAYNIPLALRLSGALDRAALARSLGAIVDRHEALRTTFASRDGQPIQVIAERGALALDAIDLRALPAETRHAAALAAARAEAARPFDLARGPLVRATLLRLADDDHLLLLVMHHIVSDDWSAGVLFRELGALYSAYAAGRPADLPYLPIQYADFAVWQRQQLQGPAFAEQVDYWRQQLAGAPTALELPTDRRRPAVQTFRGATYAFALPERFAEELDALGRSERATLFMALLAGFQALLARYTAQTDIVVGSPTAGRTRAEVEELIGFFINMLALRADLSGDPTFRELLRQTRETALGAYARQDVPFEAVVDAVRPDRRLSHAPLFQVVLTLQNAPQPERAFAGLRADPVEVHNGAAQFDMILFMSDRDGRIDGMFEYNADLFDAPTIARMAGHLQNLLAEAAAAPDRPISRAPILSDAERRQLLFDWNATAHYPAAPCLHQRFEAQAQRSPDAVALIYEAQALSYGELNARANRMAHHLIERGVGPDTLVALRMDRSIELVVAILGVLKAGSAYLPLDPSYPSDRLAYMLDDSRARVIVTNDERRTTNDEGLDPAFVDLRADAPAIAAQPDANPRVAVRPERLAYVIYTSGSTGRPKGVEITHANVARLFSATDEWFGFGAADVWTLFHSYAFDFSVWELWGALLYGGRLVVAPYLVSRAPETFYQLLAAEGVTVLNQTPSAFRQLIAAEAALGSGPRLALRYVIFGGEALELQSLRPWFERHGDRSPQLVNMYGITETTVHVTYRPIGLADLERGSGSVIGGAIPDLQVYVLDRHRQPAPIGVAGELYVGGSGLARGYLRRPDLTAERFMPNPFVAGSGVRGQGSDPDSRSPIPDPRLYRTGDLARWLPGGELEYLGRIDQQVKLRGFRIELGEIAAALAQHPAVRHAAVIVREDAPGDQRLAAYIVQGAGFGGQGSGDPASAILTPDPRSLIPELRAFLAARLPDYMIPAAFVTLDALPLTTNGKLDRSALPAPDAPDASHDQSYRAPRTPTEREIAAIWAEVLRVERVGAEDDFFALGGHSLLATQVVTRMRRAFQIDLPVRSLFEQPTVAALAGQIDAARWAARAATPIARIASDDPPALSFGQQRLWFLDQLETGATSYNMPFAIRLDGPLDADALERSLSEIVRRHASLRTTFGVADGRPVQVIAPAPSAPLPLTDLSGLPAPEREARILELAGAEFQHAFDLARGPLLRAALLRLGQREHALLVNFHHIVFDGWSYGVFVNELSTLYAAFAAGQPSPLPDLPIQYADFAAWQREQIEGEQAERQMSYWRAQLGGDLPPRALPLDRPKIAAGSPRGASSAITLPARTAADLLRVGRAEEATPFMTLLALLTLLLARQTGQDDILVGAPIANRAHPDAEGLIGFFLNTLVLRADLAGDPTFRELLRRVRETALSAYAHQDLPFEKIVEQLQPERDLERTPFFDVLFNYVNNPPARTIAPGLTLRLQELDEQESKFPITLYATEQDDELRLLMVYQTALFAPERIAGLLDQLGGLAAQVAAAPDRPIGAYSLVTPASATVLPDPRAALAAPAYPPITTIIAGLAASAPIHPAITQRGRNWSYADLVESARSIAETLVARGMQPGDAVAVSGPRSFGLIAGMLAALMGGGKLLTLDQRLPAERRQVMLRAAGAKHLLWADPRAPQDEIDGSIALLRIDPDSGAPDARRAAPLPQIRPEDPAYIFFTSGTTGVPKGVLGQHNGLSHFLAWQRETFAIGPQDRAAQLTGLSFDVVLRDIFTPLTAGATLCLPDDGDELGAAQILPWLERERITMMHTVPALAQSWLADIPQGVTLRALRLAFFAGEPLRDSLIASWRAAFPQSGAIVNLYGPTETTLAKCFYQAPASPSLGVQPVGRPLPHTQALVLSAERRMCGVGEVGEIAIRTPFRSLGYINAPDEQRKRFIANPFRDDERDLIYMTGDRGRYRPDGQLEILGRVDHQIKIRGVRIEPDEVAALLARHPSVRACAVVAQPTERGEYALVAYVVTSSPDQTKDERRKPKEESGPSSFVLRPSSLAGELRDYLARQLPAVMLPSAYVPLSALPLTPNGKLDRRALPPADLSQPADPAASVAPRNAIEEIVAGIWAEVLRVERVGVEDGFFEIGGHSLLAAQVASRIGQAFKITLPVRALFEEPTVARLARYMVAAEARPGQTEKIAQILKRIKTMSAEDRRQTLQQGKPS